MTIRGVGGVFFRANNPEKLYQWYESHLGLERSDEEGLIVPTEPRPYLPSDLIKLPEAE